MTVQITVLGLGQVGTSIGLALAERKDLILRVGNDREPVVTRGATKLGAFDQIKHNLPSAVENADLVILAMPVDEIRKTLEVIAQDLKPGAVVVDTSPVKIKVMEWAQELLPAERYFVSMSPTLNPDVLEDLAAGTDAARADLFKNSMMVITHLPGADADALKLVADLATLLGGLPFFADPWEADGLLAASHLLPKLLAAALTNAVIDQPGWAEGRKLAGKPFAVATSLVLDLDESKSLGQAALLNRENSLRVLDNLIGELEAMRADLAGGDEAALTKRLERARHSRAAWWGQRASANWMDKKDEQPPMPTAGEMIGRLVGLGKKKIKP